MSLFVLPALGSIGRSHRGRLAAAAVAALTTTAVVLLGAPAAQAATCTTWDGALTAESLAHAIKNNPCVSIAPGTFQIPAYIVVPAGHMVTGAGASQTVLQAAAPWNANGFEGVLNVLSDTADVHISNLTLDANKLATYALAARGMVVYNTVLENATCNGVGIAGRNVSLTNSTITRNGFRCDVSPPGAGVYVDGSGPSGRQLNPYLGSNTITANAGPGVDVNGAYGGRLSGNTITGNGNWAAVSLYGAQNWSVTGNTIRQPGTASVHPYIPACRPGPAAGGAGSAAVLLCQATSNDGLATSGNTIGNNAVSGTYGILLIGAYPTDVPKGNTLSGNDSSGSRVGCADDYRAGVADSNAWTQNTCSGSNTAPVYFANSPCYPGGGSYSMRISPNYGVIRRLGNVTLGVRLLQAGRVCGAGNRLALYARGRNATVFHLSRTLSTDAQGLARTTYVRPAGDFRWYVAYTSPSGRVVSPIGLLQVR